MADVKPTAQKNWTRRVPPGTHSLHVTVNDKLYAQLEATADGRRINIWLSKLIERHISKVPELSGKMLFPEA